MATASTSSNTSAARSAADGNELLDLRDAESSKNDTSAADNGKDGDPAPIGV